MGYRDGGLNQSIDSPPDEGSAEIADFGEGFGTHIWSFVGGFESEGSVHDVIPGIAKAIKVPLILIGIQGSQAFSIYQF